MNGERISMPKITFFASCLPEIWELELILLVVPCLFIYRLWKLTFFFIDIGHVYEWSIVRGIFDEIM